MSTDLGALRHQQVHRPEAGLGSLVVPDDTSALDEIKMKIHYIWNPFIDISLVGPEGLRMKLGKGWSYYGVGKPGEELEAYQRREGDKLLRCVAYPVWSIYYKETKYNMGDFTPEEQRTGNDLGAEPPLRDRQRYAGICAADFLSRYREDYGARVLVPFIGMDEDEQKTVAEIFRLVQPFAYKLTNIREEEAGQLRDEETLLFDLEERGPADQRIRDAKLDATLAKKAHETRRILRNGTLAACTTARAAWADLNKQLNNSRMGQTGFKKEPAAYDRQVAALLGVPVPAAVMVQPTGDPELRDAVSTLTENVTTLTNVVARQAVPTAQPELNATEMKQLLADIKAERKALENERKKIEALTKKAE